jgi:hypothetical protein
MPQAMAFLGATDRAALIPSPAAAPSAATGRRLANGRLRRTHHRSRSRIVTNAAKSPLILEDVHPAIAAIHHVIK